MQYKGQYTDDLMYAPGDVVLCGSSSFVARKMTKGERPSLSSPCWGLIAAGGKNGQDGAVGATGQAGKDGDGVPVGGNAGQVLAKFTDNDHSTYWTTINTTTIGAANEDHTHYPVDVIGLSSLLQTKSDAGHKHRTEDVVGLDRIIESFAPNKHKHSGEDIIGGDVDVGIVRADQIVVGLTVVDDGKITSAETIVLHSDGCDAVSISREVTKIDNVLESRQIRVASPRIPSSSSSIGSPGEISWDDSYIYICVRKDTWKRSSLSSW